MSDWTDFVSEVQAYISELRAGGCDAPLFRGHRDETWPLLCGLGRLKPPHNPTRVEIILYFISRGGPLLERQGSSWDVLFAMQHHGLPTRLLDWSTTFAMRYISQLIRFHLILSRFRPGYLTHMN